MNPLKKTRPPFARGLAKIKEVLDTALFSDFLIYLKV
jgi:hypothetical protein